MSAQAEIEDTQEDYTCLCGNMHVETGVKVIIGVGLLALVLHVPYFFVFGGIFAALLYRPVLAILELACLISAMVTEKTVFLVPYVILQALRMLADVSMVMWMITYMGTPYGHNYTLIGIIYSICNIFLPIWFISIVYKYYKFLEAKTANSYEIIA